MLPSLAAFPALDIRKNLTPQILEESVKCYHVIIQQLLHLPLGEFNLHIKEDASFVNFIVSLMRESSVPQDASTQSAEMICQVRAESFHLTHRVLKDGKPTPPGLLEATFLEDLAMSYPDSKSCKDLLEFLWDRENLNENSSILERKIDLVRRLEAPSEASNLGLEVLLGRIGRLVRACYQYGQFLMLGSDFLESLVTAFENSSPPIQEKVVAILYWTLKSLLEPPKPKASTLLDHLYTLKHTPRSDFFVEQLIVHTPILDEMQEQLSTIGNERARSLMQELSTNPRMSRKREIDKGKSKVPHGNASHNDKTSLVAQVRDFFPDHSFESVVQLLHMYHDNVERVIAHISDAFDASPPEYDANTNANLNPTSTSHKTNQPPFSQPQNLPILPPRHNIHDNDAFDRLAVPTTSISIGRANPSLTADAMLAAPATPTAKEHIMAALAAFDMDNDERDDTYDAVDVGGIIDPIDLLNASDDDEDDRRDGDEAPDTDADQQGSSADRGRGRGRGRGRARGGARGASVAGPSNDRATQAARQRKDANKSSVANHNRRDQRARKMARAGGMLGG